MSLRTSILIAFSIIILFFIQLAGTLVESIYILDLMNTKLDEKALGVLFFFAPALLFPLFKREPRRIAGILTGLLIVTRGLVPYLNTSNRLLASGLGTTTALALFFLLLYTKRGEEELSIFGAAGSGFAITLSVFLRVWGTGLDLSLIPAGGWIGWILGLLLGMGVIGLELEPSAAIRGKGGRATSAAAGLVLILTLFWFSFSAPSAIARWTEGNYTLIATAISLLSGGWVWISLQRPQWVAKIGSGALVLGNVLFTASLTGTLLAQRVPFPPAPDSAPVTVASPSLLSQILLIVMLVTFPILFVDLRLFLKRIQVAAPAPGELARGFLLGVFIMVLMVFINIFSNVWGYVPPVSPFFRGTFWLAYFILAGIVTLLAWAVRGETNTASSIETPQPHWEWGTLLALLFIGTVVLTLPIGRVQAEAEGRSSLTVMTFNTQQSNDESGERSFEQQLELMRQIDPDVIALQESDSARISINNNDYVRYFANRLGYYSYYGPTPVTGTYGTAILSRFPLMNTRTVFTYSDTDEIGTAEAEIEVGGRRFTIYNVHPAGSEAAMLAFATSLLERTQDDSNVIALGDYNLRDYEAAYQLIDRELRNAWTTVYPSEISPAGVDMSGENRIDHIFISLELDIRNPVYLLPPASATDHPVHWVEITWENR